jgi:hypothetical protein
VSSGRVALESFLTPFLLHGCPSTDRHLVEVDDGAIGVVFTLTGGVDEVVVVNQRVPIMLGQRGQFVGFERREEPTDLKS